MTKMAPADKTKMSSTRSSLRVFIYCFFLSRIVEFDANNMYIYIFFYIRTRFAEIYWYNNNNKTSLFQATSIMSHPIPLLIADLTLGKKVVFRQLLDRNFTKYFACGAHFQFHDHLKKLIGIKFLNTKQFPVGFSPRVLPSPPISPRLYPLLTKTQKNELVLINYSWISPPLQWGWGLGFYISKNRRVNFPSKKERLLWDSHLWLLLIFVFVNPRNIAI